MNDSTHPTQDGSNDRPADASQGAHSQHEHTHTGSCAFDPITRAFRVGCADAKQAAKDAMPVLADALTKAAYHAAYGISFAASFPIAFLRHACPDIVKSGLNEGLAKGTSTGENLGGRCHRRTPAAAEPHAHDSSVPGQSPAV